MQNYCKSCSCSSSIRILLIIGKAAPIIGVLIQRCCLKMVDSNNAAFTIVDVMLIYKCILIMIYYVKNNVY